MWPLQLWDAFAAVLGPVLLFFRSSICSIIYSHGISAWNRLSNHTFTKKFSSTGSQFSFSVNTDARKLIFLHCSRLISKSFLHTLIICWHNTLPGKVSSHGVYRSFILCVFCNFLLFFILHFITPLKVFEKVFWQIITRQDIVYLGESRFPHGILKSCFLCFCTVWSPEHSFLIITSNKQTNKQIPK